MLQPIKKRKKTKASNDEINRTGLVLSSKPGKRHHSNAQMKKTQWQISTILACHSFTSLKLALLVLQSLVSLNSLSLFCFKNVLVKTKTPVSLPWALASYWEKTHDLGTYST